MTALSRNLSLIANSWNAEFGSPWCHSIMACNSKFNPALCPLVILFNDARPLRPKTGHETLCDLHVTLISQQFDLPMVSAQQVGLPIITTSLHVQPAFDLMEAIDWKGGFPSEVKWAFVWR